MHSEQTNTNMMSHVMRRLRLMTAVAIFGLLMMPAIAAVASAFNVPFLDPVVFAQDPAQPAPEDAQPQLPDQKNDNATCPKGDCIFQEYLNPAVVVLTSLVGIGVTASIIYGGIQYATSADSPQKVSAAKTRIVKSIFVLLAYFLFYAFLNWIIPGGIQGTG